MQYSFIDKFIENNQIIHLTGIGGISMSGIASILLDKGFKVSGSDIKENDLTLKLRDDGCKINIGHSYKNIESNVGIVVYTAAVKYDNEEIKYAIEKNIPIVSRAEFLGMLTEKYKKCVTISGTHGKTTTTSMFSYVMLENNLDPTILLGGELSIINGNFRVGRSEYLLMEACEYKESFLNFSTDIGVILNIDKDHLDYYKDLNHIKDTFRKYADKINDRGVLVACSDDPSVMEILNSVKCKVISYGVNSGDVRAQNVRKISEGGTLFDVFYDGNLYKDIEISVLGDHNVLNALASIAFSFACDLDFNKTKKALKNFKAPKKRFEIKGKKNNITLIEDYAHHPTEIKATINTAKSITKNDIFCVFQPHTYSRTLALFDEFSKCFDGVDELILLDIYAAREKDPGNVNSKELGDKIRSYGQKCYNARDFEDALSYTRGKIKDGDIFLTIGAGNVGNLCDMFIKS